MNCGYCTEEMKWASCVFRRVVHGQRNRGRNPKLQVAMEAFSVGVSTAEQTHPAPGLPTSSKPAGGACQGFGRRAGRAVASVENAGSSSIQAAEGWGYAALSIPRVGPKGTRITLSKQRAFTWWISMIWILCGFGRRVWLSLAVVADFQLPSWRKR